MPLSANPKLTCFPWLVRNPHKKGVLVIMMKKWMESSSGNMGVLGFRPRKPAYKLILGPPVAPYAGAWIETRRFIGWRGGLGCRPLRGGVD